MTKIELRTIFNWRLIGHDVWKSKQKSRQHCERSELHLLEWKKVHYKCQNWSILETFWKPEAYGQTVLPDRSILIVHKWF